MLRRTALTTLWMLVFGSALAVGADQPFEERFDQSFSVSPTARVSLDNVNGDATIEVWDRDEVRVQAVKRSSSADQLTRLRIEIDASADRVDVNTRYPTTHGFGGSLSVEYTLTVPRFANLESIELVNGDLKIAGVEGGVDADCVNGEIRATGLAGRVELESVNGAVELEVDGLGGSDSISLESVNGSIELRLGAGAGAVIDAETVNGRISNDLGLEIHKGRYVGSSMHGTVGGGGAPVSLETVNGPISVRGR